MSELSQAKDSQGRCPKHGTVQWAFGGCVCCAIEKRHAETGLIGSEVENLARPEDAS